ncbi:AAA family ATPase [Lusitaniella coriacea LEGE 07157]|uniref:AAA family ATPase n=1 Tax=Lusitaniella coriacea LEGE 07157 TaxID=945747 RepID=A0A8J7JBY9_9CYAN|nr:AAA family ATPase [Lusitaniella coriacea LEGE 07157]
MAEVEIRTLIEEAHERAVAKAIEYIEQKALGGEKSLIIASFQQGSSREGSNPIPDPLLHTHAISLPVVYDRSSGRAESLYPSARMLYRHKMAAGAVYRAELASELQQNLGVLLQREKSWFELQGFSREEGKYLELMNHFSSRRLQIEAQNPQNAIEAQKVAYETRKQKQPQLPRSELFAQWQKASQQYGFGLEQGRKLLRAPLERTVLGQKWQEWRTLREAATSVVRHQSHFTHRDLVRAVAEAAQTRGLNSNDVLRLTKKYLSSRQVIELGRIDGEKRFANKRLYKMEKQLLSQVRKLEKEHSFRVAVRHLRAAAERHHLTREQTEALQEIARPGRIKVLCGLSGTGKSHTLAAACQGWEKSGYEVLGVSLSARQAQRLAEQTGMGQQSRLSKALWGEKQQSVTLAKLLWEIERAAESQRRYGRRSVVKSPLSAKTVVVVDNAQGIGVSQMKRLVEEVRRAGAKLVLSGDLKQPQAYEHSGALKAVAQSVGAAELKKVQRQEQTWAKQVVQRVGSGQARKALQALAERGLLSIAETKEAAIEAVVQEWSERGLKRPQEHLMIAETMEEVRILNRLAQSKLVEAGNIGKTAVRVGGESIRKGERVKFRETSRTYGVMKNGMGTVRHIDPISKVAVVRLDTGRMKAINLRHYKGIELGYAVTTTEAKDVEVRHSYVLTQGTGRDAALVQVSRAKVETKVFAYVVDKDVEATLKLARQMSWSKESELGIMVEQRRVQEQGRER